MGSEGYKNNHMGLIFGDGLSFSGFERNKVFLSRGDGTYADLSSVSGGDSEGDCRAAIVSDLDDDGDPDLFVNAIQRDAHLLLKNNTASANKRSFLKIRLKASQGHRDGIGAIVTVRRGEDQQCQVLSCGSGFESQHSSELIFGMGDDADAEVKVQWPGRSIESFGSIARGSRVLLIEGGGTAQSRAPRTFSFERPRPRGVRVRMGETLGQLNILGSDGTATPLKISDSRKTVLNFWASTCVTCIREMPIFETLQKDDRYDVVTLALDPADRIPVIERIWKSKGFSLPWHRMDDASIERIFDVTTLSIPVTIVLDASGKIESIWQGAVDELQFK